jgi:hypothetical protein
VRSDSPRLIDARGEGARIGAAELFYVEAGTVEVGTAKRIAWWLVAS